MRRIHFTEFLRLASKHERGAYPLSKQEVVDGYVYLTDIEYRELKTAPKKKRAKKEVTLPDGVYEDSFPPCVMSPILCMREGENPTHTQRFLLVSFLSAIGMLPEKISEYFATVFDYDEFLTNYQINHIVEKGYTPPSCAWIKSNRICPDCDEKSSPLARYAMDASRRRDRQDS